MRTAVITGASGNVGRHLVAELVGAGVAVRAVTRDPAGARWPTGARAVAATDAAPALDGADTLFVNPRAVGATAPDLLAAALDRGVRRVVVLSAINVEEPPERQPSRHRGDLNREVEDLVTAWPGEWVALRPSTFDANAAGLWARQVRAGDRVSGPWGDAGTVPIHERDVAAVAAAAVLGDELVGRRVPLTGPAVCTPRSMVADLGTALGRALEYVEITPGAARERMLDHGFPAGFVDAWLAMQEAAAASPEVVGSEVPRILGRPARTFRDWAHEHAGVFVDGPVPVVTGAGR